MAFASASAAAFDVRRELVEGALPERAVALQEVAGSIERRRREMALLKPPDALAAEEPGALEDIEDASRRQRARS